ASAAGRPRTESFSIWLWITLAPASMQAMASAATSAGVFGTCGLCERGVLPLIAASMISGSMFPPSRVVCGIVTGNGRLWKLLERGLAGRRCRGIGLQADDLEETSPD